MKIYTRQDYMNNKISHNKYYAQFVNEDVKKKVIDKIGIARLLKSTDEHLNDIPLELWEQLGGFEFKGSEITKRPITTLPIYNILLKMAGESFSSSTAVCIYKQAARELIKNYKNKKYG